MQSEAVGYRHTQHVGLLLIDHPPVNVLGAAVRASLAHGLQAALADDAVQVIVIASTGKAFCAGADIAEFNAPMKEPTLQDVFAAIEAASKPVVAAMHGVALGGGLELALACHYRVASRDAKLGLPEITLGVIPGAGGTQRLPRIIGAVAAFDMIVGGTPVDATTARHLGLIDALIQGDLMEGAHQFAEQLLRRGAGPRPTRDRSVDLTGFNPAGVAAVLEKHSRALKGRTTQQLVIEALSAAIQPNFDAGLAMERRLADYSLSTTESRALRHLFFAAQEFKKLGGASGGSFELIGPRMMDAYASESERLMQEGATPEQVDSAMETFGFSAGPARSQKTPASTNGVERRAIDAAEIMERCVLQLINMGARLLEEGVALRAADIDVLWAQSYGFPRYLGGPMFYAGTLGLAHVRQRLEYYRLRLQDDRWTPALLIERLARRGETFEQWDSERRAPEPAHLR
ncbi:enoyl-CoA hydratase/isomerase family protein [Steroidobacter sp. S1-65]|uniref:Enoyl-CoA hydratase/isomerase family protein n=1 Tax=Steroidobacter gossypii TaxID=2805490 RepID=A0ABS1WYK3_9GAMM|nr:enoyl-CoA hydratase/isomerase family protein [Steroidobacter gossypii]MBM0106050.1 enoyl-CoA hydratase/isomerase family protein [Steroidobacter gossypii]